MTKREIRVFPSQIEVRAATDDAPARIRGYAAVFDTWSEDLGGFIERIAPGAFKKTIQEADVRALLNHDPNYILGRNRAKPTPTLALAEDDHGLSFEIIPPDTQYARDLMVSLERGDINQMSFGFRVVGEKGEQWDALEPDAAQSQLRKRTLLEVQLFDVSPVTFPAYPDTEAYVRSLGYDLYHPEPPQEGHSDEDSDSGRRILQARYARRTRQFDLVERSL